ncbi:MAG TPA: 6-hydroxymethylpterin diphosphokinase MptE-like protein [Tepidisphaeraceae bacterium]|nr:6-hydroxymethylpterin diphosphokinase MptE-like protein [Tepidisphaeraceae bacterium]
MTASIDQSLRYMLPDDAAYLKNLAALWAMEPHLAREVEALSVADASIVVEPSKSGEPTARIHASDGRMLNLHSRYKPIDEASKLVDSAATDELVAFYVSGFGLGYHVQELFDRCGDDSIICVFEPDLRILRAAFENRDFSRMIESGRVFWFWRLDKAELFTRLTAWQPSITMGISRIIHPPSLELAGAFHNQMHTWVQEFCAYAHTTVNTLVLNGKRTAENVARNLPWYVATPSLSRLKDQYKGKPAIIVSAGPSLRKNKHLLKDAAGKAVIVAVQTTLQPLLELGVEPNFVTSLDYHDISTRFWENLPRNLKTELIAEPKAASSIFELNPGPLSVIGNEFAESLLAEMKLNKAKLPSGATVAHLAYYVAEHLGCNPIIFVGQDLGFSDGLCYAPGTSYEDVWRPEMGRFCTVEMKQWEQIVRERGIMRKVPDYQGQPMYTEERLFTYLQHFERDFARTKTKIIDATEGGVLKRGAQSMTLHNAITQFCTQPLAAQRAASAPIERWDLLGDCTASLKNRRSEAQQVEQISRKTLPLLEEVRDNLEDQARVNRIIGQIDQLRVQMTQYGACYNMIMQLTQQSELVRFKADRRISAARISGIERQKRQVQRDIDNVNSVIEATIEFQRLMDKTLDHIDQFIHRTHRREAA